MPLLSVDGKSMGFIVMIEDISAEKRMKSTMSRYIDPSIADRLMADKSDIFDGQNVHATILFSDIRVLQHSPSNWGRRIPCIC